jgi:hypothetical protein
LQKSLGFANKFGETRLDILLKPLFSQGYGIGLLKSDQNLDSETKESRENILNGSVTFLAISRAITSHIGKSDIRGDRSHRNLKKGGPGFKGKRLAFPF